MPRVTAPGLVILGLLIAVSAAAGAGAEPLPPLGRWTGPGSYCSNGSVARVPEGHEGISFGSGMEMRRLGDGADFLEFQSFPAGRGLPSLEAFAERIRLSCREGFALTERVEPEGVLGGRQVPHFLRRCDGEAGHYGLALARLVTGQGEAARDVSVTVTFGTVDWSVARLSFEAGEQVTAEHALAVLAEVAAEVAPCTPEG